ncbi:coproporphyrinogen III oxidase [Psychromonas sp. psych-6C06]|uniref:coproporphyrinogen III oxidase n=1 Tax=Psychromonas sp. psych-6C06 TaxID=2058089 RepID=UPI000C33E473|nr:coproporphyrinogen III oxidase [Psychromonas sp. psych-6C06]PKF63628.1 coproporphyrinogen III oxidase [Psychromonas sp. psych-6C06]
MRQPATSKNAINALKLLSNAQQHFVKQLSHLCQSQQQEAEFIEQHWLRDEGQHGGGIRFEGPENSIFNRASVNVSQVQYEDSPHKTFLSATALSTIIHPNNPLAPSVHIHVSWTELREGKSYWRLMADLNPSIPCESDTQQFNQTLQQVGGQYFQQATELGNNYFYIPALQAHRGVSHFYLESFNPDDLNSAQFASEFAYAIIDCYIKILGDKLACPRGPQSITASQKCWQLDYHTLYFYQVLTLDKGTTAGLLIHNQNDIGTLGSLPRYIDRNLLLQWAEQTPSPRNKLVYDLVDLLPIHPKHHSRSEITADIKAKIAVAIRQHYQEYPL